MHHAKYLQFFPTYVLLVVVWFVAFCSFGWVLQLLLLLLQKAVRDLLVSVCAAARSATHQTNVSGKNTQTYMTAGLAKAPQ